MVISERSAAVGQGRWTDSSQTEIVSNLMSPLVPAEMMR
jgi:hypothetical protein